MATKQTLQRLSRANQQDRDRRSAASECVRIVALLTEAKTPHAKELALLVLMRLRELVQEKAAIPLLKDEDFQPWLEIVRRASENHDTGGARQQEIHVLDLLNSAITEAHLVKGKISGLIGAGHNRHGDLQVTLSALKRLQEKVQLLIGTEESS